MQTSASQCVGYICITRKGLIFGYSATCVVDGPMLAYADCDWALNMPQFYNGKARGSIPGSHIYI